MFIRCARAIGSIALLMGLACATAAQPRPIGASTSLHRCGPDSCLRISGNRPDPAAAILVAGHYVAVQGQRHWSVSLPLPTVREWSAADARSIAVEVKGAGGGVTRAALPIGLLGHVTQMAYLEVGARP